LVQPASAEFVTMKVLSLATAPAKCLTFKEKSGIGVVVREIGLQSKSYGEGYTVTPNWSTTLFDPLVSYEFLWV